jgi:hypothetical protein
MSFRFESARARWGVEDYLDALRRSAAASTGPGGRSRYIYGMTPLRSYMKLWYQTSPSALDRSVFAFVDPKGMVYRADSARKRGRMLGSAEQLARTAPSQRGLSSPIPRAVGDASRSRRHHHRTADAPTFAQQRAIGRKMRILERENAARRGKAKRSQAQMLAIAYRYAGVPPRGTRRSRR